MYGFGFGSNGGGGGSEGLVPYGIATGTNTYAVTTTIPLTSLAAGKIIEVMFPANANTAASTLNVNSLGAVAIVNLQDTGLVGGEILNNTVYQFVYTSNGHWQLIGSAAIGLLPIYRYVYLLQDASDVSRMGGIADRVYSTFQTVYNAANALQLANGGIVIIMVGNTTTATVGNLVLSANWNTSVRISGINVSTSILGTVTGDGYSVTITGSGFSIGAITTTSSTGNAGAVTFTGPDILITAFPQSVSANGASNGNGGALTFNGLTGRIILSGTISSIGNGNGSGGAIALTNVDGTVCNSNGGTSGDSSNISLVNTRMSNGPVQAKNGGFAPGPSLSITKGSIVATISQTNATDFSYGTTTVKDSTIETSITRSQTVGSGIWPVDVLNNVRWTGVVLNNYNQAASATLDATNKDIAQGVFSQSVSLTCTAATLSITAITAANFPANWPVRFYAATGKTITFTNGSGANAPHCIGALDAIINGTNGDWIEFTKINSIIYQTNGASY